MKSIPGSVRHAVSACLLVLCVVAAGPALAGLAPSEDEVIVSAGSAPATTASSDQQRLIRALLASARKAKDLATVTVDYPIDGTIFPPEIISPTFLWHDAADAADSWLVEVSFTDGSEGLSMLVRGLPPPQGEIDPEAVEETNEIYQLPPYEASAKSWKPSHAVWQAIKDHSGERTATLTFVGYSGDDPNTALSRGHVKLTTSKDPVGAPVFYRDVPLMPPPGKKGVIMPLRKGALPLIKWRLKDISRADSRVLLENMPTCANCHSFSADGDTIGMDIDGPRGDKGSYAFTSTAKEIVIGQDDVITWNSYERKKHKTLGFMSQVSPDGKYAVTSLNEQIYVANFPDYKFGQVFYLTRGILAYYSEETGEMLPLPGADDERYVHVGPTWSPDGKWLIFSRGEAKDPYPEGRPKATYANDPNEIPMQYGLYRMPFNGGRGGTPEPVVGASNNGMSNSFPKVSPDGKWIVWVQAKNGLLMRPDSKLWIVPFEGGEPRLMNANTDLMNSWHSFSPNGRWLVFSSKSRTPYTQMFLTHIDESGHDSPAILIENTTAANRAVNIPEFINRPYAELASIEVPAVQHFRHFSRAQDLGAQGKLREAVVEYKKAMETDTGESRIPVNLSKVLMTLGEYDEAYIYTRKALEASPLNFEMHMNYGILLARRGDVETGLKHISAAIRINPRHPQLYYNRATLHLQQQDLDLALVDYNEALELEPRYPDALTGRGMVLHAKGDLPAAMRDFEESVSMKPAAPEPWFFMALIHRADGELAAAKDDLDKALEYVPPGSPQRSQVESLRQQVLAELSRSRGG